MLQFIFNIAPILIALVIWFVRLERRLTRIETTLQFMQKTINSWPHSSETHTS